MSQQIGKGTVEKIQELVGEGVRNIREMEGAINVFVKNDIFQGESLPPRTSGHFFPERRNLQNHMCRASVKLRFSKIDQENLSMKVDIWRKEKAKDTFFSDRMVMTNIYRAQSSCFSMKMVTKLVM